MLLPQHLLPLPSASANFFFPSLSRCAFFHSITFRAASANVFSGLSVRNSSVAEVSEPIPATVTDSSPTEGGPIELPPSSSTIFAASDEPSPFQAAASLLLTGTIAVFLFRSLRRRAKRATETRFTTSGEKNSLKEEALESMKSVTLSPPPTKSPPTPVQAFLGALAAAVIALILYRFTTTVESALDRQTISDNYSVRQITITIRTIINGLCYLATFVFGANSLGLLLYSGQLAINSFMDVSNGNTEPPSSSSEEELSNALNSELTTRSEDPNSEKTQ